MSSSDYVPYQDDASDPEMPGLIADQDFLDPKSDERTEAIPSTLSSSATESVSEEILDSFSCKTSEATVTVSLAMVSLSKDEEPIASSSDTARTDAVSPVFVGACIPPSSHPLSWYKGKYPEGPADLPFGEPLITGRSFSISQLDLIDDAAIEAYRSVRKDCTPIPAGFWIEFECLDFLLDFMLKNFETSLPNEEWVYKRLAEGSRPSSILKRFLPHFYFMVFSSFPFLFKILISLSFFSPFFFRLYETYSKEQVRWSEIIDRKKILLTYLARVSYDQRDKDYFCRTVKEVGDSTGSLLTAWIL